MNFNRDALRRRHMIRNITIQPWNSTLMSAMDSVLNAYGISVDTPTLYAATGYGFLMSIDRTLCPSGPYCWQMDSFYKSIEQLGITMKPSSFLTINDPLEKRMEMFIRLKEILDEGYYASLLNWEFQVIYGYENKSLLCKKPWENVEYPPEKITFPAWEEWTDHRFAVFFEHKPSHYTLEKSQLTNNVLHLAVDEFENNEKYRHSKEYACGRAAYDYWRTALLKEYGKEHGNCWNAKVWSECRKNVGLYFKNLQPNDSRIKEQYETIASYYFRQADALLKVGNQKENKDVQIEQLQVAYQNETSAIECIKNLL